MAERKKTTGTRKLAAAVGVAAIATASGGIASAATSGSDSSSKIFACYSDSTKALYYTTSSACRSGRTNVSWNVKGPQGPSGPAGPQGPQGALSNPAYVDQRTFPTTGQPGIASTADTVVTSSNPIFFTSAFSERYVVNATVTVQGAASRSATVGCYLRNFYSDSIISPSPSTSAFGSTPIDYVTATRGRPETVAMNGVMVAATNSAGYATARIETVCKATSGTAVHAVNVDMVMAQVSGVTNSPVEGPKMRNRFSSLRGNHRLHPELAREHRAAVAAERKTRG